MSVNHVETVLVAQSDDHLAAVEEAKRTGQPFKSVGATGSNVVPHTVAAGIAEEKALKNTYVDRLGRTYAAHLQDFHEAQRDDSYVTLSNEEKARQHEAYSADLVRAQRATEAEVQKKLADGYDVSLAVQQANLERAQAHEKYAAEYEKNRQDREKSLTPVLDMVAETVKLVNSGKVAPNATLAERVKEMAKLSSVTVPEAMEQSTENALVIKDRIIASEIPYDEHTATAETLDTQDRPATVVLANVSSPEHLEEVTRDAQIAAGNSLTHDGLALRNGSLNAKIETDDESASDENDEDEPVG